MANQDPQPKDYTGLTVDQVKSSVTTTKAWITRRKNIIDMTIEKLGDTKPSPQTVETLRKEVVGLKMAVLNLINGADKIVTFPAAAGESAAWQTAIEEAQENQATYVAIVDKLCGVAASTVDPAAQTAALDRQKARDLKPPTLRSDDDQLTFESWLRKFKI